jgi:uncharacterized PurR-regulated membrane protein YhhQ (DUF165 family)
LLIENQQAKARMKIYLAMVFIVFELLSMIFNQYFQDIHLMGTVFPLNISVVFFCCGFFILDVVTELYDSNEASKLIYGKIICLILFVSFARIGIVGAGLQSTQLSQIISTTPLMIFNGAIASLIGYKITTGIMQNLKLYYQGRYLVFRYLSSTLPGEISFSLVFTILSYSSGRGFSQTAAIFVSLTIVKIALSLIFALLVVPITNLLIYFGGEESTYDEILPFS